MDATVLQTWRDVVVSADDWRVVPEIPNRPGLFGGQWVRCVQTRRIAWMKPAAIGPGTQRVSREKVAFDLAHELGIAVPPVLLCRYPIQGANQPPLMTSLSLVCREIQTELGDELPIELPPSADDLEFIRSLLDSRIIALDVWLGNADRQNPRNMLIGRGGGPPELLYIDFSESMNWSLANQDAIQQVRLPKPIEHLIDPEAVIRGCREIEAMDPKLIREVVERIPDDFVEKPARDLQISGLLARRNVLVSAVEAWYR